MAWRKVVTLSAVQPVSPVGASLANGVALLEKDNQPCPAQAAL